MGTNLVTLAEYKEYANITSTKQDAIISPLLSKVSDLVKSICRRSFIDYIDDSKVETTNGGYGSKLYLQELPLISVTEVEYSSDNGFTYTDLVEYTDYVVDIEGECISTIDPSIEFSKKLNGYRITYTAGYESVPNDLKLAVLDLITYYIKNDGSVHSPKAPGTNSVQIEYITTNSLPAHISRVLNLYKLSWD
jgi:hypothetical protein